APVVAVSLGAEVRRELPRLALVARAAVALAFLLSHRRPAPAMPADHSASPDTGRQTDRDGPGSLEPRARRRRSLGSIGLRLLPLGLGMAAAVLTLAAFGLVGA